MASAGSNLAVPVIFRGCILFVLLSLAIPARAAFVKQPYLQNLTETTITVRWQSAALQGGRVQYGLSPSYGHEAMQGAASFQHEIVISPLLPDTLYHYRAISDADTSADFVFHTPVALDRPFRFIAYGDNRTNMADHQLVVDQMALVTPPPGLLLNVGDLTATGSTSDYQTFFSVEQEIISRTPLFPTLGNHDTGFMGNWYALFTLPGNERWYSVRYGNSSFHILDCYSAYSTGSPQYDWFLNELKADSADATVRHIFVSFHPPPYTTNTGHSSDLTVRQFICPLLERFHVQVAFMGHVHAYERSLVNGVNYVITGGGGAPLYTGWGAAQPWTVYREACLEFTLVDVRGDTVDVQTIKPGGEVIDPFRVVSALPVSDAGEETGRPDDFALAASPNPNDGIVRLTFMLPVAAPVDLGIYTVEGRRLATVVDRAAPAGRQTVEWDAGGAPSGAYLAVLRLRGESRSVRFVLLR